MNKALLPLVLLLILGCGERLIILTPTPIPSPTPTTTPEPRYVPDSTPITGLTYQYPIASECGFSFFCGCDGRNLLEDKPCTPKPAECPIGTKIPFDEPLRRKVFQAIVLAQDYAQNESEKTGVHWEEYELYLYAMITERFNITTEQMHCIGQEGQEYWWPLPPEPHP